MKAVFLLLVDDDEDDYILTLDLLNRGMDSPFNLHWSNTYEAGLVALSQIQPDLVIVDFDLNGKTGSDFICEARERGFDLPILLLTGRDIADVESATEICRAVALLSKNKATPTILSSAVRNAIRSYQQDSR